MTADSWRQEKLLVGGRGGGVMGTPLRDLSAPLSHKTNHPRNNRASPPLRRERAGEDSLQG